MEQTTTLADELIKFFVKNDLTTIFGVLGDAVFSFFDALGKQNAIQFYGASSETCAAFMAAYYAKLTGQAGICVATSGPGATSLLNGLADAYFDKAPVLAITGQVSTSKIGTSAKQYLNQQSLMQSVTKASELVTNANSVIPCIAKALVQAVQGKTVAHVSIPIDLFAQNIAANKLPKIALKASTRWGSRFAADLEDTTLLLETAQRPIIIIGKGEQGLTEPLINLAEKAGAGIIVAQQVKGVRPDSHPLVLGGIGEAYIPSLLAQADIILLIGTASFEAKFLPGGVKLIQLVEDEDDLDFAILTKSIVGETRQVLKALNQRVSPKLNQTWKNKIALEKQQQESFFGEQKQAKNSQVHPAYLMTTLSKVLPKDSIIVCDIGSFMHWFDTYFQAEKHKILISHQWRSMGYGLAGAVGACVAQRDKKVFALMGDGGLLMSLGEFATLVKYNLPITIVVANNQEYNLEKSKMEAQGLTPFGYKISPPNFAALAQAFGLEGRTVNTRDQLEAVLQESLNKSKPFLIDVNLASVSLPFL